jgi:adenosyl cobinamide kinase/adenosyl cobinamide phosphate guanylyltransferase
LDYDRGHVLSNESCGRGMTDAGLTLVLGGARSGKSRYAEALLRQTPPPWCYVATAQAFDDEMAGRIDEHRARRAAGWETIEAPLEVPAALRSARDQPLLLDCLTLWLTNLMLAEQNLGEARADLDHALASRAAPTILVSNEVGLGIVPDHKLGRAFRDQAGLLHQHLAARADRVVLIVAGLPMILKGSA